MDRWIDRTSSPWYLHFVLDLKNVRLQASRVFLGCVMCDGDGCVVCYVDGCVVCHVDGVLCVMLMGALCVMLMGVLYVTLTVCCV